MRGRILQNPVDTIVVYTANCHDGVQLSALPTLFGPSTVKEVEYLPQEEGTGDCPTYCSGAARNDEKKHAFRRCVLGETVASRILSR